MNSYLFIVHVDTEDRTYYGCVNALTAEAARARLQGWANVQGWGKQDFCVLPVNAKSDFQWAVWE